MAHTECVWGSFHSPHNSYPPQKDLLPLFHNTPSLTMSTTTPRTTPHIRNFSFATPPSYRYFYYFSQHLTIRDQQQKYHTYTTPHHTHTSFLLSPYLAVEVDKITCLSLILTSTSTHGRHTQNELYPSPPTHLVYISPHTHVIIFFFTKMSISSSPPLDWGVIRHYPQRSY